MDVGSLFKTKTLFKKKANRKTDYILMSILHADVSKLVPMSEWLFLNVINSESIYDRLEAVYGSM